MKLLELANLFGVLIATKLNNLNNAFLISDC